MITEKDILKLKNETQAMRDQVISAKSTLESVNQNIENYEDELRELGIDPADIENGLTTLNEKLLSTYNENAEKIAKWKEILA